MMLHLRPADSVVLPRTDRPARQIVVFLGITYVLALAIALALPHAGIAPLITIAGPLVAVWLTIATCVPRGQRRAVWAAVGFGRPSWRALLLALGGPVVLVGMSFGVAAAVGVVRFPALGWGLGTAGLNFLLSTAIFGVVFLGEEIGWRGFLLLRLAELTSGRRAALVTGACHAVFHLPLLVLTTTYQNAGSRWVVVPMVMVTLTMAGGWYGWLRAWSGSIWPVSVSHAGFNNAVSGFGGAVMASSPAAMAYVTTETGVVTMLLTAFLAGYLLTRRAADFENLEPRDVPTATSQAGGAA
jgi:membrane protease YdiL (CAAX protease family)